MSEVDEGLSNCVAVVGMACRLPGARGPDEFWKNLREGVESVSFFSDDELDASAVDPAERRDPNYVRARATLEGVESFDAGLFGFSPREAELTDPQHRVFLECSWEALEHAGYDPFRYPGSVGVYGGAGANTYLLFHLAPAGRLAGSAPALQAFIHNKNDHLAARVAYKLNLRGPAVGVQTACSTSLVAVAAAVQALLGYQVDMALAGGSAITVPQRTGYLYHERGIGSPDGHCRAFDADAKGTVGGNGAGVVVLKRYEDAVADGDTVYALVRAVAVNNDGALRAGYTAPAAGSQAEVVALAHALAGVSAETITYVEAHGTGTPVGDPIEVEALTQAFRRGTRERGFCALGSVKTNLGHLDAAAGVAGLIKAVLALRHRQLPPSLHFRRPNPQIDFASSPFYVNTSLRDWRPPAGAPRRAGVSSFGLGGTNAHAVLEEAPPPAPTDPGRPLHLLLLSAQTVSALEASCRNLAEHLKKNPSLPLADVAHTLQVGRRELPHRRFAVCRDVPDAIALLETLSPERVFTREQETTRRPLTFLFPGQGAQFVGMGAELYRGEATFREHVDRGCALLEPRLGLDLRALLYPDAGRREEAARQLDRTAITQPALFVVEYAMAQQWMAWGVRPDAMLGHSVGEFVAACLAGVFSFEDALALVAGRGRLMQALPEGAMLAVPLSERDARPLLGDELSLAAVNGPAQCVVSGPRGAVAALADRLAARKLVCRPLATSHAFHSRMMEPALGEFRALVAGVERRPPSLRYLSNLTGDWVTAEQATDPAYWAAHLRETVRFGDGLARLLAAPDATLLEVGPGRTLRTLARWHPQKKPDQFMLASLPHPQEKRGDYEGVLHALGHLWLAGVGADWPAFYAGERRRRVPLPTYPFERRRYWVDPPARAGGTLGPAPGSMRKRPDVADWFYAPAWRAAAADAAPGRPPAGPPSTWLLFEDGEGLVARVGDALEAAGHEVVRARAGAAFEALGERSFALDPRRHDDYEALAKALREAGRLPRHLVHGFGLARGPARSLDEATEVGFGSLLSVARAFGARPGGDELRVTVLASRVHAALGSEAVDPRRATVVGACQVIPREYPSLRCRLWDVDPPAPDAPAARALAARLARDLASPLEDAVAAYRGDRRWVREFAPLRLPEAAGPGPLRPGGAYLVTGGFGGLGLEIAGHLARAAKAKLALIGRSAPPQDEAEWAQAAAASPAMAATIAKLRALKEAGAEVLALRADVADEAALRAAIDRARERFGPLRGVVHAAGVPAGALIPARAPEAAAAVLAPKARGAELLDALLAGDPLDFFVVFSSLTTVVGRLGQADYTAANAFLDAFAYERSARTGRPTVAINWGAWEGVGMAAAGARGGAAEGEGDDAGEPVDHPLLDRRASRGPGRDVYITDFNVERHWVLDEHRILGNPVVPGVAYFEMARAALGERAEGKTVELRDVLFLLPLRVKDGETRRARLSLDETADGYRFAVRSSEGPGARARDYTAGHLALRDAEPLRQYDLAALRARCDLRELLLAAEEREEDLGPRWHSVQRVHLGRNEVLLYLELPEAFAGDFDRMKFHPALLDRAAGIAKNFLVREGHYLPLTYKRVQIKAPLQRRIYSYARYREENDPTRETITFDIVLMDEQGRGLVEIEGFSQKRVNDPGAEIRALADAASGPAPEAGDPAAGRGGDGGEIAPAEGVEAFARVLAAGAGPQIVVSVRDLAASIEQSDRVVRERIAEGAEAARARAPAGERHPRPDLGSPYVAPRDEAERRVAEAWQDVLGIDRVGIHDNFFELGGDSLAATQVLFRLEREFDVHIPPVSIFEGATIAKLVATFVAGGGAPEAPAYEERQSRGELRRSRARRPAPGGRAERGREGGDGGDEGDAGDDDGGGEG
ncbi:MAG TPA: SDR family NAD(P)-dependent oxidoreductase [Polyangiaceae bacterium]|nr:SDR family NAD(P)-dependent oxidoreductase [Polyangiaceae bacterium]